MTKQEQAVKALTRCLNKMMTKTEQEVIEWYPDKECEREYMWTFRNLTDGAVTELVYGFRSKTVTICRTPTTVEQWEAAWSNYIFRLKRLDELKARGRYGYQLRMPRLAIDNAIKRLRKLDPDFCKSIDI